MPEEERDYLVVMFRLIDQGFVTRVSALRPFLDGRRKKQYVFAFDQLIEFADQISPPWKLRGYHRQVVRGIRNWARFLEDWYQRGDASAYATAKSIPRNSAVLSASTCLQ